MKPDHSFVPLDEGVVNLHQQIKQAYKQQIGGADLNEFHLSRILKNGFITYRGNRLDFANTIESSKQAIATIIADRMKSVWVEEVDFFDAIFLAGGGGIYLNLLSSPTLIIA
ncbi:hypothetical protein [Bacillus kwashiorkori]|uniref:hypothetical protein n=1 Tax=Bacillus kwashiorkori TaxID=1522318 RepID=UPI0007813EFC|nr:hypothetical protein [Bacillus kwashiorkori]